MSAGAIASAVASALDFAVLIAKLFGDLKTAKRVEEILDERFPTFQRRAEEKMDEIARRLNGGPPSP